MRQKRLRDASNRACDAPYSTVLHTLHIPPRCLTLLCHSTSVDLSVNQPQSLLGRYSASILRYDILCYVCAVLYCTVLPDLCQTLHQLVSKSRLLRLLLITGSDPSSALNFDPLLSMLLESFSLKRLKVFPLLHV